MDLAITKLGAAAVAGTARRRRDDDLEDDEEHGSTKKQRREDARDQLELLYLEAKQRGKHEVTLAEVRACLSFAPRMNDTKLKIALLRPAADESTRIAMIMDLW